MSYTDIKYDCRHFVGYIPCKPNKQHNVVCNTQEGECKYYSRTTEKILIIKLGAAGDVIRTTPLLYKITEKYPNAYVYWLTQFPDLVPERTTDRIGADKIMNWELNSILALQNMEFDWIINLDKDEQACGFTKSIKGKSYSGYTLVNNKPYPINEKAEHKYFTGVFDEVSQKNTKNYMEEIFEICDFQFNKEEYILPGYDKETKYDIDFEKTVVGLNTGCGGRWTSRLWPENYWLELIQKLKKGNYEVVILGGPEEHEKNTRMASTTNTKYFGVKPLKTFIGLMDQCDIIVSAVTMGMHLAIGLQKKLVLLNNIFNRYEFELYGRGEIIEPSKPCTCYFTPKCKNEKYKCIEHIKPERVYDSVKNLLK
jgi:ADP-heptose:LPS heptosyltransferase